MSKSGRGWYGRWIAGCFVAGACFAGQAAAATFFEDVQGSLTCTGLATPDERAALRAAWLTASDAAGQRRYFGASRAGSREFHFRYLTLLQAVANLADEVDDQVVRREVLARMRIGNSKGPFRTANFAERALCRNRAYGRHPETRQVGGRAASRTVA